MRGIYKVIDDIYANILKQYGYHFHDKISSNIHPSVVYISVDRKTQIQIGFDYTTGMPFSNFYGKRKVMPVFRSNVDIALPRKKLLEYSEVIVEYLKNQINTNEEY